MKSNTPILPGLGAAVITGILAFILEMYVPALSAALLALLLGLLAGNSIFGKPQHQAGIRFTEKYVLETAIVGIGFGFKLSILSQLGWTIVLVLLATVSLTIVMSLILGRLFRLSKSFSILLGAGSAICGSAAIGATAPIIKASEEETGLSLTLINLLGLLGIAILPVISIALDFNDLESGVLNGGVLQSMGHVVAAAFSLGDETGKVATVVKMGRIAFLVPLLLILYFRQRSKQLQIKGEGLKFPYFIGFFVLAVILSQLQIFPSSWSEFLAHGGDILLVFAMAAIGLKIRLKPLLQISLKGTAAGLLLFSLQIIVFLLLLEYRIL